METKELIKKAFDWYYEKGISHTNISNEDAVEFFMETIEKSCECCGGKGYLDKSDGFDFGRVDCPIC